MIFIPFANFGNQPLIKLIKYHWRIERNNLSYSYLPLCPFWQVHSLLHLWIRLHKLQLSDLLWKCSASFHFFASTKVRLKFLLPEYTGYFLFFFHVLKFQVKCKDDAYFTTNNRVHSIFEFQVGHPK